MELYTHCKPETLNESTRELLTRSLDRAAAAADGGPVVGLAAGGMYMLLDKGLLKTKGAVAQSIYAEMAEDTAAKDKRIAELEKQLEMGGSTAGGYEAPKMENPASADAS